MNHETSTAARLLAASLAAPRFKGRVALLRLAQAGDECALRTLELTPRERDIAAVRGELSPAVLETLSECGLVARRAQVREERAKVREEQAKLQAGLLADVLATREPGNVRLRVTRAAFGRALKEAGFREAKHSHTRKVELVEAGEEGATSVSSSIWASEAGLGRSYQKVAYRVATSLHAWRVSPAILSVPREQRWDGRFLWLSPDCRVRQGRGTSLVCERRVGGKWRSS